MYLSRSMASSLCPFGSKAVHHGLVGADCTIDQTCFTTLGVMECTTSSDAVSISDTAVADS